MVWKRPKHAPLPVYVRRHAGSLLAEPSSPELTALYQALDVGSTSLAQLLLNDVGVVVTSVVEANMGSAAHRLELAELVLREARIAPAGVTSELSGIRFILARPASGKRAAEMRAPSELLCITNAHSREAVRLIDPLLLLPKELSSVASEMVQVFGMAKSVQTPRFFLACLDRLEAQEAASEKRIKGGRPVQLVQSRIWLANQLYQAHHTLLQDPEVRSRCLDGAFVLGIDTTVHAPTRDTRGRRVRM